MLTNQFYSNQPIQRIDKLLIIVLFISASKFQYIIQFFLNQANQNIESGMKYMYQLTVLLLSLLFFTHAADQICLRFVQGKCQRCKSQYRIYRGTCLDLVPNCLVYEETGLCQICEFSYQADDQAGKNCVTIKQNGEIRQTQKKDYAQEKYALFLLDLDFFAYLQGQNLWQTLVLNKIVSLDNNLKYQLITVFTAQDQEKNDYYKFYFRVQNGLKEIIIEKQVSIYKLISEINFIYNNKAERVDVLEIQIFEALSQQITQLSPFLLQRPYTVLEARKIKQTNLNKEYQAFILDQSYGIIKIKVSLATSTIQLNITHITEEIKNSSIIYNIQIQLKNISETQIAIAKIQFIIETGQIQLLSVESNKNLHQYKQIILNKFISSEYSPNQRCPNRLPSFIGSQASLSQELNIARFFKNPQNGLILSFINRCYPLRFRNQLLRASVSSDTLFSYIHIQYQILNEKKQMLYLSFVVNKKSQSEQEVNDFFLDQIVISSKDKINTITSEAQITFDALNNFDPIALNVLTSILQFQIDEIRSAVLIEVNKIPWLKFQTQIYRYIFRYEFDLENDLNQYVEFRADKNPDGTINHLAAIFIPRQQYRKLSIVELQSGLGAQINTFLANQFFINNNISEPQIFAAYQSIDIEYKYLLSYLLGQEIVIYQFDVSETSLKKLRSTIFGEELLKDQLLENYIIYGVKPELSPKENIISQKELQNRFPQVYQKFLQYSRQYDLKIKKITADLNSIQIYEENQRITKIRTHKPIVEVETKFKKSSMRLIDSQQISNLFRKFNFSQIIYAQLLNSEQLLEGLIMRYFYEVKTIKDETFELSFESTLGSKKIINLIYLRLKGSSIYSYAFVPMKDFYESELINKLRVLGSNLQIISYHQEQKNIGIIKVSVRDQEMGFLQLIIQQAQNNILAVYNIDNSFKNYGLSIKNQTIAGFQTKIREKANKIIKIFNNKVKQISLYNLLFWKEKIYSESIRELEIYYEQNGLPFVIKLRGLFQEQKLVQILELSFISVDQVQLRKSLFLQINNRTRKTMQNPFFSQTLNNFLNQYSHFVTGFQIIHTRKIQKNSSVYFIVSFQTTYQPMQALIAYSFLTQKPSVLSINPIFQYSNNFYSQQYICSLLARLEQPKEYCLNLKRNNELNSFQSDINEKCRVRNGIFCLY